MTDGFSAFVVARQAELVRFGWALTGERQLGEDLAQAALERLWPRWSAVAASGEPRAYTQRIMVNLWSSWRSRRRWQVERVTAAHSAGAASDDVTLAVDEQDSIDRWLALLPPRRRAVVVLRFLCDLSVAETADRLGCSAGTVKSQTVKAIGVLRETYSAAMVPTEEAS